MWSRAQLLGERPTGWFNVLSLAVPPLIVVVEVCGCGAPNASIVGLAV